MDHGLCNTFREPYPSAAICKQPYIRKWYKPTGPNDDAHAIPDTGGGFDASWTKNGPLQQRILDSCSMLHPPVGFLSQRSYGDLLGSHPKGNSHGNQDGLHCCSGQGIRQAHAPSGVCLTVVLPRESSSGPACIQVALSCVIWHANATAVSALHWPKPGLLAT